MAQRTCVEIGAMALRDAGADPDAAAALRRGELAGSLRDLSRMALAAAP